MNEAGTRGLHKNEAHKQKAFKVFKERTSNKIYLTESEIQKIIDLDLSTQPALGRERDRFLISYFFVMRYSDSVRIQRDLFFEEEGQYYYRNIAQKTNRESIIPVKPVAWQILQKYNFSMAGDTNQEANRKLKIIMAMAGLTEEAREGEKVAQKCVFVTTHTARRSAATNLYLKGTSLKIIADLGGWENAEVLRFYLRGSGMDSAKAAKDLDFLSKSSWIKKKRLQFNFMQIIN
ncbi:MAG: tyrosine-type recombinase/integrase [Saprospiraceae bacterium]|nr:tyrosine-type recombinase/integrase [Saprospiraceae bacterium]